MKILLFLFTMASLATYSQKVDSISLYPKGQVPGAITINKPESVTKNGDFIVMRDVQEPQMYVYRPKEKKSDACVMIYPGGGYYILAIEHEGFEIANWFNQQGITAVVVKYRLPQENLMTNKEIRPLQDAQQALRLMRKDAAKYGIDPNKIGVMGFSAGGHLASTVGTHFENPVGEMVDNTSVRPDFLMLIYPVISFTDKFGHIGSRDNLLGKDAPTDKIDFYSNDKRVTTKTPPTFLLSTSDDFVHAQNSIAFYSACKKNKVPAELHIYEKGGHGYALRKKNLGPVESWGERLTDWLMNGPLALKSKAD